MSEATVLESRQGRALLLRLNRPRALNALSTPLLDELRTLLELGRSDPDVAVVILASSEARAFSAGMDVKETVAEGGRNSRRLLDFQWFLETYEKPLIASLRGHVSGGGAELALSADIRVGDETTRFRFPASGYGIVQGTWHLIDVVGASWAKQLVLTGREVAAEEALRLGLLHELVADPDARAVELADQLASRSQTSLLEMKALFARAAGRTLKERFDAEYERNLDLSQRPEVVAAMRRLLER